MRARPTHSATLGSAPHAIDVFVPDQRVSGAEHFGIALRAFYDSVAARTVADHEHTYYLRALEQQYQQIEGELLLVVEGCLAAIDRRASELADAVTEAAIREPAAVAAGPAGTSIDRATWAHGKRAGDRARAAELGRQHRVISARKEVAVLATSRCVLLDEADAARLLFAKAFGVRAALYTRRRFGLFGMGRREVTQIPEYACLAAPPAARRALPGLVNQAPQSITQH